MKRHLFDYGMVFVLLLLCVFFSVATLADQHTGGASGGEDLAREVLQSAAPGARVVIIVGHGREDGPFAAALAQALTSKGVTVLATVRGHPRDARKALEKLAQDGTQ